MDDSNDNKKEGKKDNKFPKEFLTQKDIFKIALKARDFEIKMFWQRCYYFLFLNISVGAAVATALAREKSEELIGIIPFLCFIGAFVCFAWIKVGLGATYWQQHWESIVVTYQKRLGLTRKKDIFSIRNAERRVEKGFKERKIGNAIWLFCIVLPFIPCFYKQSVLGKPSVSGWMHITACFFFFVWVIAFFHYDGWVFVSDFICDIFCRDN